MHYSGTTCIQRQWYYMHSESSLSWQNIESLNSHKLIEINHILLKSYHYKKIAKTHLQALENMQKPWITDYCTTQISTVRKIWSTRTRSFTVEVHMYDLLVFYLVKFSAVLWWLSFENEALENEDRSTKRPKLENEAPKTRKRGTQNSKTKTPKSRKRSTQNSKPL